MLVKKHNQYAEYLKAEYENIRAVKTKIINNLQNMINAKNS